MTPTTVKVPQAIEPLFTQAEAVVSEYFAQIKQDPTQGTIEIGGERYLLVRGAALSVEFFTLARNLYGPGNEAQADGFARNILFDLAHVIGKSDAENFHKRLNLTDPIAKLSAGPVHFAHTGWAFVEISPESHPTPDKDYYLLYDHPYSFEADAWLRHGSRSEAPVCVMNAGYASGWCEASFGIPLVAVEVLCRAKGDSTCRFIMAPPGRIAEHLEHYLHQCPEYAPRMQSYGIPEFFVRKRMEEELQASAEALTRANQALAESARVAQAANNAKSMFLANMSHEIRTPLNAILGFTALLRQNTEQLEPDEQRDYLDTIHTSGQHLLGLINDVLDLSKIESDALDLHLVPCSPTEVLNEVVSTLWVRAAEKRISLDSHWVGPVPRTIHTDPARLRQLLMNLVVNAIKFTKRGGVAVVARTEQSESESLLVVEISDTGVGIPADKLQAIFEPFVQADSSLTREFTGTGLGLTISRRIAETLGGSISVISRVNRGSTFTVKIPIGSLEDQASPDSDNASSAQPEGKQSTSLSLDSVRILVVEDVEANQKMVRLFLKRAGALVETAENGQIALDWVARQPFDLIFMDMQMPVMDGYTATQQLRERGLTIPIIALTAHAMDGDEAKCRAAGCSGYLSKPIDPTRLVKAAVEAVAACPAEASA